MPNIAIIAGEASGELHGSNLVKEIKRFKPETKFFGIGGDKMQNEGVETLYHIRQMSFLGFVEIIKHIPFIKKVFRDIEAKIFEKKPDALILIDYPGFNLRLAEKVRKILGKKIKIIYYISPQIWAWGKGRVKKIAQLIDKMIVVFPFEEEIYKKAGVDVTFVGHPILEALKFNIDKTSFLKQNNLDEDKQLLGLLPGSRLQELNALFPVMIETYKRIKEKLSNFQVVVGVAPTIDVEAYKKFLPSNSDIKLLQNSTYGVMKYSNLVIVASGTATLETACWGTPMIVVYKVSNISWYLGRMLVSIKNIALPNIIAGETIVPEILQHNVNVQRLTEEVLKILQDDKLYSEIKNKLSSVKSKLGEIGASKRAAEIIVNLLYNN
jgi:lipid-A-disaccharide synthase